MALIGVVILSALLMALAVALGVAVQSDTQLRGAYTATVTGFYAAESGLNKGMGEYRNIFLDYNVPHGSDFSPRTLTIGDRSVTYQMTERAGNPQNIVIPAGEIFAGLNALQYRYIVNSQSQNARNDVEASVGAEFLVGYIPLFQFVAFYKNDLEILPGPNMNLNGRVHTNGNLYLNTEDGSTLNIADNPAAGVLTIQVSAGKKIYRGRKNVNEAKGIVNVDKLEDTVAPFGDLDPKEVTKTATTREVTTSEIALWKGSIISNLGNIAIPEPDIVKPPANVSNDGVADPGVYWDKADLRLVLHIRNGSLPAGPIVPYDIEIVDVGGAQNVAKTTALKNFMADGAWNSGQVAGRGPSTYPYTMPIFVTDVPVPASGCGNNQPACNNVGIGTNNYAFGIPAPLPGVPAPVNVCKRNIVAAEGAYTEMMGKFNPNFCFDRDYRRGGFYNWREKKWMLLLNINVRDLILWNQQNGEPFFATNDSSEGGLVIFATIDGPLSNTINNYGIRVFGSADIPLPGGIGVVADPTGITIATDQAMYVLGDFNRGQIVAGAPPRQPASLIGDSVNALSQRYWRSSAAAGCAANCCSNSPLCRDGQSVADLDDASRNGANTWINSAFLGGVDTTPNGFAGNYNGGLENYPRFHEDWGGTNLTYQGSFVSLGTPEHVNGQWMGTGTAFDIYNPPARLWNYDPAFNNAANLPPLTPRFVYVQQVLFTEDFK